MEADVLIVDVGAGTSYHALDFFLLADRHIAVATPDPTSVLDLYRFVKLAAIRRGSALFGVAIPMNAALAERDFSSIEEILTVSGNTDEAGQEIARQALAAFHPLLLLNPHQLPFQRQ